MLIYPSNPSLEGISSGAYRFMWSRYSCVIGSGEESRGLGTNRVNELPSPFFSENVPNEFDNEEMHRICLSYRYGMPSFTKSVVEALLEPRSIRACSGLLVSLFTIGSKLVMSELYGTSVHWVI